MAAPIERFGKYHVLGRIARGGMAEVYKVKTVGIAGFEKLQALKRIRPHFAREPRFIRSFIDEARIAAELNHRNIVQVFDFGKADGELFLAMELIEGVDLRTAEADAGSRGITLPVPLVCYVLGEVAAGLDYAHRKTDQQDQPLGIVHCDVSPQNVMLSREGYVKILDFGVSRARFGASHTSRRLRGKPRYMAPEQTRGERPTPATDVFALGIVAWELLTGMPLFEGRNLPEILAAVRRADAPRADRLNPDVPAKVAAAVARALSPEPADRGTAGELGGVLSSTAQLVLTQTGARALAAWLRAVYPPASAADQAPRREPERLPTTPEPVPASRAITASGEQAAPVTRRVEITATAATVDLTSPRAAPAASDSEASGDPGGARDRGHDGDRDVHDERDVDVDGDRDVDGDQGPASPAAGVEGSPAHEPAPGDRAASHFVESIDEDMPGMPRLFEKRRVVAVVAVLEGGDPAVLREHIEVLGHLAYKHGGVVHAQEPDGLVTVFGLEVAGEDDVAKAMTYALDAVEATREGSAAGRGLAVRIAARAGIVATHQQGGYRLVGNAVEETRALARGAEPSRPLLSGSGGRLTSAYYSFRPLPARPHGGRRLRVVELEGPRSFDELRRALHSREGRFVDRRVELDTLMRVLHLAIEEDRRVIAGVVGASGMGKSRLVAELAARSREAMSPPPVVVAVAATPLGRVAPFSLLIDLVQVSLNLPAGRGQAARARLARRLRHTLTRAGLEPRDVDEVTHTLQLAMELRDGALLAPAGEPQPDLRERLLAAMRAWREAVLPRDRLCIVVLEDLHFADESSREVLAATVSVPMERAELILVTVRPTGASTLPSRLDARLSLGELDGADLDALIRDRLGPAATDETVAAVARRAGGNPLFVEQIAAAVRDVGPQEIPSSVRGVILSQVDRLPARAKAVLQHAAVIGRQVRARILEELVGAEIDDEIEILLDQGLLRRAGKPEDSEGELAFGRSLVREVVYDALSAGARRDTHARLGHLLASRHRAGRDEVPAAIAEHLELGGEQPVAAAFWLRAGRVALAAFDAAAAVEYFSRTLAIDDQTSGDARSPAVRARRREALAGREHAHRLLGQHQAQARDLDALARLARNDAALTADVENRRASLLLRRGEFQGALAAAEAAYRASREVGDERSAGLALCLRGQVYERLGAYDRSMEMNRGAQEIFRRIDATADETRAMIGIGRALLTRADYEEAQIVYNAILERVEESGDPWLERQVRNHVAGIHVILGHFEKAMDAVRRCLEICRRYGDRARQGDNLSMAGIILLQVGCYADASRSFEEALDLHELTGSRWSRADTLVYAGAAAACQGAHDRAWTHLDQALALARALGDPYLEANALVARAGALLQRDRAPDLERAAEAARAAAGVARRATLAGAEIQALSRQAEATWRLGRTSEALALSRHAVDLLDRQRYVEGSEEEIYFTHYRILKASGEAAGDAAGDADRALARARASLQRKLDLLREPRWREAFARDVAVNAQVLAAAGGSLADGNGPR